MSHRKRDWPMRSSTACPRPRILGAFGWRTLQVLARDWYHDREAVLETVERALREPEVADPAAAEAVVSPLAATTDASGFTSEMAGSDGAIQLDGSPPPSVPLPAPMPETADLPWRRLEFVEGSSRKFWQARREDVDVVIAFGRIGTAGQSQRKQFADAGRAEAEMEKLVAEKLRKGYISV